MSGGDTFDAAHFDVDAMIEDLRRLVEIESPSNDLAALTRSAAAVAELLGRCAGVMARLIDGPAGPHVWVPASGDAQVLVVGHHDTVFPVGALAARPFTVADGRATGPGVFDMKAGIVLAAHALGALDADARSCVEVLITADEEVGSLSSKQWLLERAEACGAVLVFEPAGDGGALKTGRKGIGTFSVDITGRAAHAGLEPHLGVNALVEAAHQVLAVAAVAAPERGTTVTPTMANAGTAENVVPAAAHVRVDARVTEVAEGERVERELHALAAVLPDATLTVTGAISRPPMSTAASASLFAVAEEVAVAAGLPAVTGISVGGASDGNFTAAAGIPTLDGLGATGGGAHADHEWIDVAALPARASLIAGILARLTC